MARLPKRAKKTTAKPAQHQARPGETDAGARPHEPTPASFASSQLFPATSASQHADESAPADAADVSEVAAGAWQQAKAKQARGKVKGADDDKFVIFLMNTAVGLSMPQYHYRGKALQHGKTDGKRLELESMMKTEWKEETPKARTLFKIIDEKVEERLKVSAPHLSMPHALPTCVPGWFACFLSHALALPPGGGGTTSAPDSRCRAACSTSTLKDKVCRCGGLVACAPLAPSVDSVRHVPHATGTAGRRLHWSRRRGRRHPARDDRVGVEASH
jgi:hypothetical protein